MATRWYRLGTVAATNGDKAITGTDTFWQSGSSLKPEAGDLFTVDFSDFYEVEGIVSDTQINLFDAYRGTTATGASYAIVRSASVNINTRVANMVTQALNQKQRMLDEFDAWLTEDTLLQVPLHDSLGNELLFPPLPILIRELGSRGESSTTHSINADYTVLTSDLDTYTYTILNLQGGGYTITVPDHAVDFSRVIECIVESTLTSPVTIVTTGSATLHGAPITIPAGSDGYIRLIVKGTGNTSKDWFAATGYYIGTDHQHSLAAGIHYDDTQSIGQDTVQGALDEHGRRLLAVESSDWAAYAQTESHMNEMIQLNTDFYAASGFVHYGLYREDSAWFAINEGMYGIATIPDVANRLFFGRTGDQQSGESKLPFPRTHIAGFISDLLGFNDDGSGHAGRAKFPEAPDGTVIYDSTGDVRGSGEATLDLTVDVDPKYGDVAATQNEAVGRAFEGLCKNGNNRNINTDWTQSGTNKYQDIIVTAGQAYRVTGSAVAGNVAFYDGATLGGGAQLLNILQGNSSTAIVTPTQATIRVFQQNGWGTQTSSTGLSLVTEEVVTDRVDMFGGEFFLEAVTQANPYVYPKGMIQSRATTMNGITTVRSNRPSTYYSVYDGDVPASVFTSIDFGGGSGGWIGNHVTGDANGHFEATTGTGPRTPIGTLQVGRSYTFMINATVSAGDIDVWYWDGANNTNLGDISQGSFTFTCQEADGQVYLRSSFTTSVCNVSSVELIDNSVVGGSVGLGVDFFAASLEQKRTMLSDSSNGLYLLDNGVLAQWRMRQRTVAGAGNGDWGNINPTANDFLQYSSYGRVNPQGSLDTPSYSNVPVFVGDHSWNTAAYEQGVFTAHNSANDVWSGAIGGRCYFYVWGTVPRLNQGAFVPSINETGARTCNGTANQAVGHYWWHSSALRPRNRAECFRVVDANTDTTTYGAAQQSGYIGTTLFGRDDGRFYDAIYAEGWGGVSDDRLSAFDMSSPEEAAKIDAKVKGGLYRGKEPLVRTQVQEFFDYHNNTPSSTFTKTGNAVTDTSSGYGWYGYRLRCDISASVTSTSGFNSSLAAFDGDSINSYVVYVGDNGNSFVARGVNHFAYNGNLHYFVPVGGFNNSGLERDAFNAAFPNGTVITVYVVHADYAGQVDNNTYSVEGDFTCKDVFGDPEAILQTPQLANGWVGYWIPTIPNGSSLTYVMTRKNTGDADGYRRKYSTDFGSSWINDNPTIGGVTNGWTSTFPVNSVGIQSYQAAAYVTEEDSNRVVFGGQAGIGNVWVNDHSSAPRGVLMNESLIHKVTTGGTNTFTNTLTVLNTSLLDGKFPTSSNHPTTHEPITLTAPANDGPAVKALNYQTAENQGLYLNYAFEELVYDGSAFNPWGDDRRVTIIGSGVANGTDTNGNSVLQGTNRLVKPYGYTRNQARAGTQVPNVDLLVSAEEEAE